MWTVPRRDKKNIAKLPTACAKTFHPGTFDVRTNKQGYHPVASDLLTRGAFFYRIPPRGRGQELHVVPVAHSRWSATATAAAAAAEWTGVGGGVGDYATATPCATRGAHHASVYGGVQRAATQRFGLLRGYFLPGGGCLTRVVEKKTVGAQQVRTHSPYGDRSPITP